MAKSFPNNTLRILVALLMLGGLSFGATKKSSKASKSPQAKTTKKKPAVKPVVKKPVVKKAEPAPPPTPLAPGELPLFAHSAVCLDVKTGNVLYEKEADEMEYPASATKILTALIVIEAGNLDQAVEIQIEDTKVEPSALEVKPGETYVRRDLLYALLLKSANDVALALARDNAGSVEAFAEKMNQRAHDLGADSSHFVNPHGLHDPHHFTTARDLAIIARAAMQDATFREIVGTLEKRMMRGEEEVILRNHNKLLGKLPGCTGIKTGFTRQAQQVLVSGAMREGREVISVVLHTNHPGIWEDSKLLLADGLEKLGAPTDPAAPQPNVKNAGDAEGK